jgi:(2R)-3-sulfolactate dehydrogenase (NADP+)
MAHANSPERRFTTAEGVAYITDVLSQSNVSGANAQSVAEALVQAEIDGQKGHGFSRVASYALQARSGKVAGHAIPEAQMTGTSLLRIDAANGFAFPAIELATERLIDLCAQTGIAAAGITRSHHCGQLGAHVERLAEAGCVAMMFANSPKAIAPWGGSAALFGTNPIAFAAPRGKTAPLVIDLSLSKVARGKVMAAAKAGENIPQGWALTANGAQTTDPKEALGGSMLPAGDAKGAALALMVEILSATLTGANHSYDSSSFFDAEGDPPGVGQFLIAINAKTVGGPGFTSRLEMLISAILGQAGTRMPGETRLKNRAKCAVQGFGIAAHLISEIDEVMT